MVGREDLAPNGLEVLSRDVSLSEINSLFNKTTGHDHDGINSKEINWDNIIDIPTSVTGGVAGGTRTFFVVGTQTTNTANWTGIVPGLNYLYDGLRIYYWLPKNSNQNVTLNLELFDNSLTGPISVYKLGNIRLGAEYSANSIVGLTYRENITLEGIAGTYTGWWIDTDQDTLPVATTTNLGAIRVGNNLSISGEVLSADVSLTSPTFVGVPKSTTASIGTNTKQIATTEFVKNEINRLATVSNLYNSAENQTVIDISDIWINNESNMEVLLNGLRLEENIGYTKNTTNKTILLSKPCELNDHVFVKLSPTVAMLSGDIASCTLPMATTTTLGGIKVGAGLSATEGVLSVVSEIEAYTLPTASSTKLGGIKIGSGLTMTGEVLSVNDHELINETSPKLGGALNCNNKPIYWNIYNITNTIIDIANGNKQKLTLTTNNIIVSLTTPPGACSIDLYIYQSSVARTITWPTSNPKVNWLGGISPIISKTNGLYLVQLTYDGTNWFGSYNEYF